MMALFCQFCGTQLQSTSRFCKNCGARVLKEDEGVPARELGEVPSHDDGDASLWESGETAIILPISQEADGHLAAALPLDPLDEKPPASFPAPSRDSGWVDYEEEELFARDPVVERLDASADAPRDSFHDPIVDWAPKPRPPDEEKSPLPLLLLLIAVLLLFLFAYLVWQAA
jgi:hypothetical protein